MNIEKERKFKLIHYKGNKMTGIFIQQGYLFSENSKELRIRIIDRTEAEICIKLYVSPTERKEFEYSIPLDDAFKLYDTCTDKLEKYRQTRYHGNNKVMLDFYPSGLQVCEIEYEKELTDIPSYCGEEITGNYQYSNIMLAKSNTEFF